LFDKEVLLETLLLISSVCLWVIVLGNLLLTLTVIRRLNAGFPREKPSSTGLRVGEIVPPFSARTLDGQTKTLADYADRTTALLFLAPGCGPCRALLPTLEKVDPQAKPSGTELLLIFDGDEEQTRALVEPFALRLPVLLAPRKDNSFFHEYQVHGTPSYYLLNKQGQVQASGHPGSSDQPWQNLMEVWTSRDVLAEGRA
jgi:thiol-disulfide isomerase/thioredoxin